MIVSQTRETPAKYFFEKMIVSQTRETPAKFFLLSTLKNECVIDPRNSRENPEKVFLLGRTYNLDYKYQL